MIVTFRRTGGFAPSAVGCSIDTVTDPVPEGSELEILVKQSGILQLQSAKIAGARDVHYYAIDIVTDDHRIHSVTYDDPSIPQSVRPLIDFLLVRSKDLMPDNI